MMSKMVSGIQTQVPLAIRLEKKGLFHELKETSEVTVQFGGDRGSRYTLEATS